jgi:hypothetical protein
VAVRKPSALVVVPRLSGRLKESAGAVEVASQLRTRGRARMATDVFDFQPICGG